MAVRPGRGESGEAHGTALDRERKQVSVQGSEGRGMGEQVVESFLEPP